MDSRIKYYNFGKGWGWIDDPDDPEVSVYFHISNVQAELLELFEARKFFDEPISCQTKPSRIKENQLEAFDIRLDLNKRAVGYVRDFESGHGWVEDYHSGDRYFLHYSSVRGAEKRFVSMENGDPVVFTRNVNDRGLEAVEVVKVDTRCQLERFAEFIDFENSLKELESKAEPEHWDYINNPTGKNPVLFSYINYTFDQVLDQGLAVEGKSSKDNTEYLYFNTGLVTPYQDEIYGYFKRITFLKEEDHWRVHQPDYEFLEFETDQSYYRKYFPESPQMPAYFEGAEVRELVFDTSLNEGKVIIDKEHIKARKDRFPNEVSSLSDEAFFDAVSKSVELAVKRIRRNYKTAIPHYYDGRVQFLLPLCMLSKKDADLALVVDKEENVYKAHTVITLDQAYNNARLLAKPDREWLNP